MKQVSKNSGFSNLFQKMFIEPPFRFKFLKKNESWAIFISILIGFSQMMKSLFCANICEAVLIITLLFFHSEAVSYRRALKINGFENLGNRNLFIWSLKKICTSLSLLWEPFSASTICVITDVTAIISTVFSNVPLLTISFRFSDTSAAFREVIFS